MGLLQRKKYAKLLVICLIALAIAFLFFRYYATRKAEFRTQGSKIQISRNGRWEDFLIKGVNIGAGKPGGFPGEMLITKDEYERWFKQIAGMNANAIRVYTILSPAFYEALFEYNLFAPEPIYLFHGAWLDEDAMLEYRDAYAPALNDDFENEIKKLVDVLHGNITIPERRGHASGTYRWDVSPYVAGYILGIELDADFVMNTNKENAGVTSFDGNYLYTENASPHECWLARIGDLAISYEMENYGKQKPVSWSNWLTTDPLTHTNEPTAEFEDAVSVDTEHIRAKESFTAGLFASYHIYPYYPEFMMYQPEYAQYKNKDGQPDPYEAYLLDLRAHHGVPVLVAEFGIPTSRGCCHENVISGYNQGFMTERQQGEYVAAMFDSIVFADYAGGLIFAWQDEWFKRSWNNMDYDDPERRAYWSNYQTAEQFYGLLAFEPGEKESISYADGDMSELDGKSPACENEGLELYAASDEKFVYFTIRHSGIDLGHTRYVIGIDSVGGQGNYEFSDMGISFSNAADTAVVIDGKQDSRVMTDAYYDIWYRMNSLLGIIERNDSYEKKNSGIFNPINLILRNSIQLPLTGETLPHSSYETGKLLHGNTNPSSPDFNPLADFFISQENNGIEIRIPWQLLGIADPSQKMAVGDMYGYEQFNIGMTGVEGFALEIISFENGDGRQRAEGYYTWDAWDIPKYHERLKESYSILKEHFAKY